MVKPVSDLQQPTLYWKQLVQLKGSAVSIRLHRNNLRVWVMVVDSIKAVASSAAISGWVIWKEWAFIWSIIIVAAQLLDALKGVFPFAKQHKAASDLTAAMETLYIDAEEEWFSIYNGSFSAEQINNRRIKLMKLQKAAEHRYFPDGFVLDDKVIARAEEEASTYFAQKDFAIDDDNDEVTAIPEVGT